MYTMYVGPTLPHYDTKCSDRFSEKTTRQGCLEIWSVFIKYSSLALRVTKLESNENTPFIR